MTEPRPSLQKRKIAQNNAEISHLAAELKNLKEKAHRLSAEIKDLSAGEVRGDGVRAAVERPRSSAIFEGLLRKVIGEPSYADKNFNSLLEAELRHDNLVNKKLEQDQQIKPGGTMTEPQPKDEDDAVHRRIQKIAERATKEGYAESPPSIRIVQLPLWPEPVRGAPNTMLRSALFAGIHSKKRQVLGTRTRPEKPLEPILIAAQNGITVKFAGLQLNQYDADVFYEALHRARMHPLGVECFFRGHDFLKTIGRSGSSLNYEDLHDSLTRLRDGRLVIEWEINSRELSFTGSLIAYYERDKTNKLYKITFAPHIKTLFAPTSWTQLEWDERMALKNQPQAQWLHGYFCSHAPPFPVSVPFLHEKTGSITTLLKHYRTDLKAALMKLEKVLGWKAILDPETDLVTVERQLSASQTYRAIRDSRTRKGKRQKKGLGGDLLPGFIKP